MDFNSLKILKAINKYPDGVDIDVIVNKTKIPKDDFVEIVMDLERNHYIKFVRSGFAETTNKGKTYRAVCFKEWISIHLISILALIVSIIALFRTF